LAAFRHLRNGSDTRDDDDLGGDGGSEQQEELLQQAPLPESEDDDGKNQCRLIFVSYCDPSKPLHQLWIREWCKQYRGATLVLDPEKRAYRAWGIPSNTASAFGWSNCWYYAKMVCYNLFVKGKWTEIAVKGGDAGQLGSDFVISPDGMVVLAYYCRDPTDRVPVQELVEAVRRCSNEGSSSS